MIRSAVGRPGRRLSSILALLCCLVATPLIAGTLEGRVLDPDGRPVPDAFVIVLRDRAVITTVPATGQGRFGPIDLPPATYELLVTATGLRLPATHVAVGSTDRQAIDLHLVPSAVHESIVVSASQVDTPTSQLTSPVTVVDRARIDARQLHTVADALGQTPGFTVIPSGGTGSVTSLLPRGGESDFTLVLVDGIVQNGFGGGFDAAHLPTAGVEQIEVVRGPQSALFGGGAIGGIVQIVTRSGGPLRVTGRTEIGGDETRAADASLTGSRGPWTFGAGADWLRTSGDTRTLPSGDAVTNDDYARASGSVSLGWANGAGARVRLDVRGGRNEKGVPGPYGSDPAGLYPGIDTVSRGRNDHRTIGLQARFAQGLRLFHQTALSWAADHGRFASPFGDSDAENHRLTGRYQIDVVDARLPVSAGVELVGEQHDNTFITDASFEPVPVERTSTGLFVEVRPVLVEAVHAAVGLRLERIARAPLDSDGFGRPAFDEQVAWSLNPKVALAWVVGAPDAGTTAKLGPTRLRMSAGTGIRAPNAFEIAFTNNPDLQPERSRSVDVGVEQTFAGATVVADATWFHNRFENLIVSIGDSLVGASRFQTDNVANATATGVEVGASWRPSRGVSIRGSWTWLDTEILGVDGAPRAAPPPYQVGDALVRRPRAAGSLDILWAGARGSAFASISGRGRMLDLEPNLASAIVENPGFTTTTIGGSVRLHPALEAYARITNAFDRTYEPALGYPARGRAAFIGIRVARGR